MGMESYLGSGVTGLREGKLLGVKEAEEIGTPLSYPLDHLPRAQKAGQTQPLACSKHSMASSPLPTNMEADLGWNSSYFNSCAALGK